jgi:hypothetical protein
MVLQDGDWVQLTTLLVKHYCFENPVEKTGEVIV